MAKQYLATEVEVLEAIGFISNLDSPMRLFAHSLLDKPYEVQCYLQCIGGIGIVFDEMSHALNTQRLFLIKEIET